VAVSASPERRRADRPAALVRETAGAALLILALVLVGFVVWFAFLSRLHYDRIQVTAYANFRNDLAVATAPTGPTNPADPTKLLAPGTPVALLSIPEIGLNCVVFEGTSGRILEGGPGHVRDSPLPGQPGVSVILGRRTAYGGPFSRLSSLHVGDVFTATTGQGVATYRVTDVRRAGDKIPPYTAGQGRLILVTADGPSLAPTGVLRVDANLTSQPSPAPAMVVSSSDLTASEQALGTDPLAWVSVVLWGALLLAAAASLAWAARQWGRWPTWIVAVPVVLFISLSIADQVARLLPNLM
jgi:LPXTG-site transpeptidase (sortase) family protein